MNKKTVFLLVMLDLMFCCVLAHDSRWIRDSIACGFVNSIERSDAVCLNIVLKRIAQGDEDVDVTEALNMVSAYMDEHYSLAQSFKRTMPLALSAVGGWWVAKLLKNGYQSFFYGCGFTYKTDPSDKKWYICDKDGNEHTVTRTDFTYAVKKGLLVGGGLWALLGLGTYVYKKHWYNSCLKKILSTPHVIIDREKLHNK